MTKRITKQHTFHGKTESHIINQLTEWRRENDGKVFDVACGFIERLPVSPRRPTRRQFQAPSVFSMTISYTPVEAPK